MRIAVNAICADNRSGTGRYATELLRALAEVDRENTYVVCVRSDSRLIELLRSYGNFELHPVARGGPLSRQVFERFRLRRWIASRKADLFHGPAFVIPSRCPAPAVVTVHDLVFHLFPETAPLSRRWYYRTAIPRSIREAAMILADSESTARDLREHFGVEPARIAAVPLGVAARFFAVPDVARVQRVKARYGLPDRFILTVGTLEPRKNLSTLLRAYARLTQDDVETPDLVIAGRTGWSIGGLRKQVARARLERRVVFTGFLDDADLPAIYRLAEIFVCVSLYEGFGLPVLEAMTCGIPVVASNGSSLPEVVGDTGWMVEPRDPVDIGRALREILADPQAARGRAERARRRAETFSWRAAAEKTLSVYRAVAGVRR
jgi:glycosyltransferase involved in cell wall biosynthesis